MDRTTPSLSSSSEFWAGEADWFGRNRLSVYELDELGRRTVGHTRSAIWRALLKGVPRTARVLEVGCGEGLQMRCLARLGFSDLMGCDINRDAVFNNPLPAEVYDLHDMPYGDGEFDLVYTSGLLIHVPPERLDSAIAAIARVSSRWVAGYEYFSPEPAVREWRGRIMWKADYAACYERAGLSLAKSWLLAHIDGSGNADHAFLLTK